MKFERTVFVGCFVLICVSAVYKDVVYVMDRSGSVKEADFDESVDFVYNVTEYLSIGTSEMQVSIVIFSSSHSEEFDLNDFTSKADLLNAIKNLRGTRTTGKTYTYDAIDYVKDNSFTSAKGGRSGANRTVVILTDGLSNNFTLTVTAADELRAGLGAEVFAIGIGSTVSKSNDELKGIASDPDSYYVHYIDTFVYLCNLIPALVPKLDSTVTPSLLADCPTPPSTTQESTTAAATTTGSTSSNTDLATATTTVTTSETTSKRTETSTSSITTDSATTTVIQTTRVGTTLAAIGTTQIIQKTGDQSLSSQPSGSSSNTAAIAAGAALGALAAAATLIVSASLLRRWHLSTKEDPMVLAAVGQYQQAPIGPSKASFSFA